MVRKASDDSTGSGAYAAAVADPPSPHRHGGLIVVEATLAGVSPLLQNAMSEQRLLDMRDKVKKPKNAAKPTPRDEAGEKLYRLGSGAPCVPARMLYAAFVGAGQFVRLDGKRQVSTTSKTVLPAMLLLTSLDMPIVRPGTEDPAKWEVDIQQGRNPNGGEAVCIIRPRFDEWEVRAVVEVDQDQMPLNLAYDLVTKAGRMVGIGDFRPQRRGSFGRFVITRWTPQE